MRERPLTQVSQTYINVRRAATGTAAPQLTVPRSATGARRPAVRASFYVQVLMQNPDDETIRQILTSTRTVAVVGWSPNPERPSHGVAEFLRARGMRVIPVNPGQAGQVHAG